MGDSSGNTMVMKRLTGPAPSMAAASISDLGNRLQPGQEEEEVVADLLPHRGDHHHDQGVGAVQQRVPGHAEAFQPVRDDPERGIEQEEPKHRGDGRRHRVGPDQQRLVDVGAADHAVGEHRQHQRDGQPENGHQQREHGRGLERRQVVLVAEEILEVLEPDELRIGAEGILHQQRLIQRLRRRQEEEDERDDELRRDQRVRQPARLETGSLFHGAIFCGRIRPCTRFPNS